MNNTNKKKRKISLKGIKKNEKIRVWHDPVHCNIPNICFSLIEEKDERFKKYKKQRKERGFDDSETWTLYYTIACFIIPRMEVYLNISNEVIKRDNKMKQDMEHLLLAFKLVVKDVEECIGEEERLIMKEGLEKFPHLFHFLWW
jgi:hypothetical protein